VEAFATVDNLQAGWRTLKDAEQGVANTLLLRASAYLITKLTKRHVDIDPEDEVQALNLQTVTCNLVRRAMASAAADGIAQVSQTIGSTNASVQIYNPDGAFYLSKQDADLLGITGAGRAGWAPLAHVEDGE
jgi:hypothetical protein